MNVYPKQYQLDELTGHLIALLERRRAAVEAWSPEVEESLRASAAQALEEAGRQFMEVVGDADYWRRTTDKLMQVAMPRYLLVAKAEHASAQAKYGVWRGGDFLSRASYAVGGLLTGLLILRTALPDWLEPLPIAFFIGGPLVPDVRLWLARRRYQRQLRGLVEAMREEAVDTSAYLPLGIDEGATGAEVERVGERIAERR